MWEKPEIFAIDLDSISVSSVDMIPPGPRFRQCSGRYGNDVRMKFAKLAVNNLSPVERAIYETTMPEYNLIAPTEGEPEEEKFMTDLIPVIRGKMGGRDYYVGTMTFQDVAAKVQFFEELKESADIDKLLQREIQRRSEDLTTYLLQQPERFYGALIVAAWGGNPNYIKVRMEDHSASQRRL